MPEGTRCSTVFLPPITRVCPALCPPWKRTTPCAWSVSQSTTFPLPSSPHWVPMTTTFLATVSALAQFAHRPLAGALDELSVAVGLSALGGVSRKPDHYHLPGEGDRKSTRLNSSHITISYAVFCLKKKKLNTTIKLA